MNDSRPAPEFSKIPDRSLQRLRCDFFEEIARAPLTPIPHPERRLS
jgi:hypothetical protein